MQTPLQTRLFEQIRLYLSDSVSPGERINEAEVAERLGVSRTPIRNVLVKLQADGVLAFAPRRGFVLKDPSALSRGQEGLTEEFLDKRVMRDMAVGDLQGVISERALMQRYSVPNGVLMSTLRRLTRDRLVEPSPGRGWIFADVGPNALAQSYRFRQIIEPAGLLADGYYVDTELLRTLDADHVQAIENIHEMGRRRLFELDARFHRVIAEGARTSELVNAVERQNNIRRVAEYIGFARIERINQSMTEHRGIIEALLSGNRQLAASLMNIHLQVSRDDTFAHMEEDLQSLRASIVDKR